MTLDLDALEALEKKATRGPWEGPWGDTHTVAAFEGEHNESSLTDDQRGDAFPVTQYTHPEDAALIAAARNALPELIRLARIGSEPHVTIPDSPGPSQECVSVPKDVFNSAINYIMHVGGNYTERGLPHPQEGLLRAMLAAAKEEHDAHR